MGDALIPVIEFGIIHCYWTDDQQTIVFAVSPVTTNALKLNRIPVPYGPVNAFQNKPNKQSTCLQK
jgi:hypothetical protein